MNCVFVNHDMRNILPDEKLFLLFHQVKASIQADKYYQAFLGILFEITTEIERNCERQVWK